MERGPQKVKKLEVCRDKELVSYLRGFYWKVVGLPLSIGAVSLKLLSYRKELIL